MASLSKQYLLQKDISKGSVIINRYSLMVFWRSGNVLILLIWYTWQTLTLQNLLEWCLSHLKQLKFAWLRMTQTKMTKQMNQNWQNRNRIPVKQWWNLQHRCYQEHYQMFLNNLHSATCWKQLSAIKSLTKIYHQVSIRRKDLKRIGSWIKITSYSPTLFLNRIRKHCSERKLRVPIWQVGSLHMWLHSQKFRLVNRWV